MLGRPKEVPQLMARSRRQTPALRECEDDVRPEPRYRGECMSVGQFTIRELQSTPAGVVSRLHMTFEEMCADISTLSTAGCGRATGELWIVNGTAPFNS